MKYRHWFHTKHMKKHHIDACMTSIWCFSRKKREEKKEWYVEGKDLHRGRDRKHLGGENHKCSPCLVPWSKYNDRMDFCLIALSHDHSENVPTGEIHWFCSASRVHEPTSGASRHLLPEEGGKTFRSSSSWNLPNLQSLLFFPFYFIFAFKSSVRSAEMVP